MDSASLSKTCNYSNELDFGRRQGDLSQASADSTEERTKERVPATAQKYRRRSNKCESWSKRNRQCRSTIKHRLISIVLLSNYQGYHFPPGVPGDQLGLVGLYDLSKCQLCCVGKGNPYGDVGEYFLWVVRWIRLSDVGFLRWGGRCIDVGWGGRVVPVKC
jgi:hypothetical protein